MNVWIINKYDCEGGEVVRVLATQNKAEKAILEEKNKQIKEWKRMIRFIKKENDHFGIEMYKKMIKNLSGSNWRKWSNYPHENFNIQKWKVER